MPIVDIHTHVYPPEYMDVLRARTTVPYVRTFPPDETPRLIVLPGEDASGATSTARGRPIGPAYYDVSAKLAFMDAHRIDISVISQANPWLDFVAADEAAAMARRINDDIDSMCAAAPGRLFAFGTLPLSAAAPQDAVDEVKRLLGLRYMRGVVMGTGGRAGRGLDDLDMDPVYAALQEARLPVFLHPHYGLPSEVYGPRAAEYGHVLPLAMGFPLETTIAVARMLLSGVFDRFPRLTVLLAHSGGTLPFLAGRLESCIAHDAHLLRTGRLKNRRSLWDVLRTNILLDAVVYSEVGLKAAIDASGADRVLFGTDHPFFPPLEGAEDEEEEKGASEGEGEKQWPSVTTNYAAIKNAFPGDQANVDAVLGGNAVRILRLTLD